MHAEHILRDLKHTWLFISEEKTRDAPEHWPLKIHRVTGP